MKIILDIPLRYFEFSDGAKSRTDLLSYEELDKCEERLKEFYPDGIRRTVLNDLFNHYFDETFSTLLGVSDDELVDRKEKIYK